MHHVDWREVSFPRGYIELSLRELRLIYRSSKGKQSWGLMVRTIGIALGPNLEKRKCTSDKKSIVWDISLVFSRVGSRKDDANSFVVAFMIG